MTPGPRRLSRLPHFTKCLIYSNLIQKICVFYSWNRTLHSGKRFWVLISFSRNMQRISEIKSQMNNVPCAMTVFARPPGPMCLGLYQLKKFSLGAYTHMLTLNKANLSSWLCRKWQSPRLCSQTPQTLPSRGSQCRWTPSSASAFFVRRCQTQRRTVVWGATASPLGIYTLYPAQPLDKL